MTTASAFDWHTLLHDPVVVAGAGRSGTAVAELLKKRGAAEVLVTDSGAVPAPAQERLEAAGVALEQGGHSPKSHAGGWLVVSPGVPDSSEIVRAYAESGKPVVAELEVASWFARERFGGSRMVAVTGTNGKTTVTCWLSDMWSRDGRAFRMGGNVGTPLSALLEGAPERTDLVLEVSSFQLDHIHTFRPDVAVLLNITPDHLDRYDGSFERYAAAKERIAENQGPADVFVFNLDDPQSAAIARGLARRPGGPKLLGYSTQGHPDAAAWVEAGWIHLDLSRRFRADEAPAGGSRFSDKTTGGDGQIRRKSEGLMPAEEIALPGSHNLANALAAALAAHASGLRTEAVLDSLRSFSGVPHRLETVRVLDGVRYVNDSKATNVNAVWHALNSFQEPVVLVMGGRDKGNRYEELDPLLRAKVRAVVAIGESSQTILRHMRGTVGQVRTADSMEEAVSTAQRLAEPGDVVLLSPACASFDMFAGYEERGETFRRMVNRLT